MPAVRDCARGCAGVGPAYPSSAAAAPSAGPAAAPAAPARAPAAAGDEPPAPPPAGHQGGASACCCCCCWAAALPAPRWYSPLALPECAASPLLLAEDRAGSSSAPGATPAAANSASPPKLLPVPLARCRASPPPPPPPPPPSRSAASLASTGSGGSGCRAGGLEPQQGWLHSSGQLHGRGRALVSDRGSAHRGPHGSASTVCTTCAPCGPGVATLARSARFHPGPSPASAYRILVQQPRYQPSQVAAHACTGRASQGRAARSCARARRVHMLRPPCSRQGSGPRRGGRRRRLSRRAPLPLCRPATPGGSAGCDPRTRACRWAVEEAVKGGRPVAHSYRMQPRAHRSEAAAKQGGGGGRKWATARGLRRVCRVGSADRSAEWGRMKTPRAHAPAGCRGGLAHAR